VFFSRQAAGFPTKYKKTKIKVNKIMTLHAVLYEYKTWFLAVREKQRQ
jgi:hypothetical protein